MCSCFKNLICCVVSQLADFSNQLPCYKAATMSYKNNFDAAVVKSIREGTFFLGGRGLGPQRGGSSVKVSTKEGGPYPLFQLFKGRVTHLFQNF